MNNMTASQKILCNTIIHTASAAAGAAGAGLAQIPGSDSAAIVPAQTAMTIGLGLVFGLKLSEYGAATVRSTALTTLLGRAASQTLVGWIPGVGNVINAGTAISITEALGWMLVEEFSTKNQKKGGEYHV